MNSIRKIIREELERIFKTDYPYHKIEKLVSYYKEEYRDYMDKQGWFIFQSDSPSIGDKYNSDYNGYFWQVQVVDEPYGEAGFYNKKGNALIGIKTDQEAIQLARKTGLMVDDNGLVYGFQGHSLLDNNNLGESIENNKPFLSKVKLSDLYVEDDNIVDAYFKAKNNLGPSSRSTGKPLAVTKLLDGSLILMDGHHRVIDRIKYLGADNIDDILNLKFDAIITSKNYEDLEEYPDGEYWIPIFDWIYDMEEKLIGEDINIPINVGDEILGGKFKNKKIKVKEIGENEKGEITINGKPLLRFRIPKKD